MTTDAVEARLPRAALAVAAGLGLVPWLYSAQVLYPYVTPKVHFLRALAAVLVALWAAQAWRNGTRIRFTGLDAAVLAFVTSALVSTATGVDAWRSFWDTPTRMLGSFTLLHLGALYFALAHLVRTPERWQRVGGAWGVLGAGVAAWAVVQRLLLAPGTEDPGSHVEATLGNALYVSGLGLFVVFLGGCAWLLSKTRAGRGAGAACLALGVAAILVTERRSGLGGLAVFLATSGLCAATLALAARPRGAWIAGALGVGVLAVGAALSALLWSGVAAPWLEDLPFVGRLALLTDLDDFPTTSRFRVWRIALETWREAPWFGWGTANFYYAFNSAFDPAITSSSYAETWFDQAHNTLLNTLTTQGVFGALAYLGLFATAAWTTIAHLRAGSRPRGVAVLALGYLAAHFAYTQGVFENPSSYLALFGLLAYLRPMPPDPAPTASRPIPGAGFAGLAAITTLWVVATGVLPWLASARTIDALHLLEAPDTTRADAPGLARFERGLALPSPHHPAARTEFAAAVLRNTGRYATNWQRVEANEKRAERLRRAASAADDAQAEELQQRAAQLEARLAQGRPQAENLRQQARRLLDASFGHMIDNQQRHPLDIRPALVKSKLAQKRFELFGETLWLEAADRELVAALERSPNRQELLFDLATLRTYRKRPAEAIALLERAIALAPDFSEGHWRLAFTYDFLGQTARARDILARAEARGVAFEGRGAEVAARIRGEENAPGAP
ncbi:MAG: O-antigen ligase family protein [Myxococcota bacterium]